MTKLVTVADSKPAAVKGLRVRVSLPAQKQRKLAYLVGIALGDGNLSNPNGRATRLRISCDAKYVRLADEIINTIRFLLPKNKISIVKKTGRCFDISVYSNQLNDWIPWKVGKGSKAVQKARIPAWIKRNPLYMRECIRGLIQTDGCIYVDRGYKMVNFTNNTKELTLDVRQILIELGFRASLSIVKLSKNRHKYSTRVARMQDVQHLIKTLRLYKS